MDTKDLEILFLKLDKEINSEKDSELSKLAVTLMAEYSQLKSRAEDNHKQLEDLEIVYRLYFSGFDLIKEWVSEQGAKNLKVIVKEGSLTYKFSTRGFFGGFYTLSFYKGPTEWVVDQVPRYAPAKLMLGVLKELKSLNKGKDLIIGKKVIKL